MILATRLSSVLRSRRIERERSRAAEISKATMTKISSRAITPIDPGRRFTTTGSMNLLLFDQPTRQNCDRKSRLTSPIVQVMCFGIRLGKPVRDRRCPATVSWAPLKKSRRSSSQATGRIDGAVRTFAGEGGFRTRIADPSALIRAALRRSWPLPFLIAKFRPKRRWKTDSIERNFQTMRPSRVRGMSPRLQPRSRLTRSSSR